ncbi:hypothetical protein HYALB_00010681 [Hymenoscyphus albidus]|uniref:Carbohydrate esterase family 4 protein n=1 Tax=Hymenoscyphus albidus TaxID=595503 RepID=A0A9N9L9H7_9HELO|nr:hypothetical protein HYALB_00010681 [Hymenoscyphus albidus]
MKYTTIIVGAIASVTSAHSVSSDANAVVPQLLGGRKFLSEMKARGALPDAAVPAHIEAKREVVERQNTEGRCGPGFGSCATGCCSGAGWCGITEEYCAAPDCLYQYGPGCDANKIPAGASTASIARPKVGSVPYGGAGIYDCSVAGDIALTFDDGPYSYTSDLLDKLAVYGAKATFFITGNNLGKGAIDTTPQWSDIIKRMAAEGHQIASHTWSHQNLSSLDPVTFDNQMIHNEMAIRNILGYFPTYMRPPYSECNSTCGARLANLGYHVTYFDLDTAGYLNPTPESIQNSKNIWDAAINPSNPGRDAFLQIEHDIQPLSVYNLTDYMLASMRAKGYRGVTVGDCLADPKANWYRGNTPTTPTPPTGGLAISTDGTCGATTTCVGSTFGNCCSQYGWCGSTADHCGAGCQAGSGTCTGSQTPPTTPAKPVSTDGTCSSTTTCAGSTFGNCCSQYGWCGTTADHCGTGCNPLGGTCN